MLDAPLRPWIDPPLSWAGRRLAAQGLTADQITLCGFAAGLGAAAAIAGGQFELALVLIALNRIADGLDGAVARISGPTDRGAFLDITLDFVFYAAVPLAFAVHASETNALAAAVLLAAFLANGTAFLAFAIMAARRGLATSAQGRKSLYYVAGLAEGAETIIAFCAMCLWPGAFVAIAYAFAGLCFASAAARLALGWRTFA